MKSEDDVLKLQRASEEDVSWKVWSSRIMGQVDSEEVQQLLVVILLHQLGSDRERTTTPVNT